MQAGVLTSRRLDLVPFTAAALDALMVGDRKSLERITSAIFPTPLTAPPLMEDALSFMRDTLLEDPENGCWGPYLLILRESGEAVGSAGFTGKPGADGIVTLGYSMYPAQQGQGLASEAARALVAWALAQPGVASVQATIPPAHSASQRVATRAGLRRTNRVENDPDEGPVEIWQRAAEQP
ncbi:MAG: GCN5-related N-acetyltransferase [Thermomicrobiales bacterium]|jgi:RimJ/RimL family protein N-acetyltransferase|nr:GCN5-related N-acetyltransferase [Thermomicrobiales bacterium]MDF3041222.1 GCN5-related N-acetyltransferase [Thermomicrobiales bacterium]